MAVPDADKLIRRVIAAGITRPHTALAGKPRRVVLFHIVTRPLSGSDVEIGGVPGQIHEDDRYRVLDDRMTGAELPRRARQPPRADLCRLAVHCHPGVVADDLHGAEALREGRRSVMETGEIMDLVTVQSAEFHNRVTPDVVYTHSPAPLARPVGLRAGWLSSQLTAGEVRGG